MKKQNGFTLFELMFTMGACIALTFAGFLVYAAFHFLMKFW